MYRENPHKGRVHLPSTLLSERDSEEAKLWAYPSVRAIATSRRKGLSNLEKKRLEYEVLCSLRSGVPGNR